MKKLNKLVLIISMIICFFCFGCNNNAAVDQPETTEPKTDNPINNSDATDVPNPLEISERATLVNEATETIDGKDYAVKSYVILYGSDYNYEYYKFYYFNDKLSEVRFYDHTLKSGCKLDYKYTEFVDHSCSPLSYWYNGALNFDKKIIKYYEDGLIKSNSMYYKGKELIKYSFYDNSKNSLRYLLYPEFPKSDYSDEYYNEAGIPLISCNGGEYFYFVIRYDSGFVKTQFSKMYGEENGSLSTYNDGVWKEGYSDADNVYIQSSGDKDDYTSRETKSVEDVEPILAEQIAAFEASH